MATKGHSDPVQPFAGFGEVEARPLSRLQQITGRVLHRNWNEIPHVTHHDLVDITGLEAARQRWNLDNPGDKRTFLPYIIKALALTLRQFPSFNASLSADGKALLVKDYVHIGVAVETPQGLLVPVLRNCDDRSLDDIDAELADLSARARGKGLSVAQLSGGCATVTSLGHIGGYAFTPIINAPEVVILGVCRSREQPVRSPNEQIAWRTMLPLSLSYDHRVINGADAARFTGAIGLSLEAVGGKDALGEPACST